MSREKFEATLAALNVKLPVDLDPGFTGSIIDATGKQVLVVDPDSERSDAEATAIAAMVATAINIAGGLVTSGFAWVKPAAEGNPDTEKAAEAEAPAAADSE